MEPVLRLNRISKSFPMGEERVRILKEVSLTISAGEFVAIIGPSGSGKSTLMNLMGLLDRPDSGTFELKGRNIEGMSEEETAKARRETLGFVFQQFHLLPRNTAVENVSMPLLYSLRSLPEGPAVALLKRVGLENRLRHLPTQLSGGQQQRVAIARALVNRPEIILADEPTGNLDAATGSAVIDLLFEMNAEAGTTLVLVTHDRAIAARCARRITIEAGRVASDEAQSLA
jgi:predicted ABC-type transport system involved in lysophospholipase L1 biosynthesis ATPase subunit